MREMFSIKSYDKSKVIYVILCLILAIIITFRIYPFIGLADGFSRWKLALEIYEKGHIVSNTLLSPILPYFQAITYALTNSYGLYTLVQCMFFYISIGILVKYCIGEKTLKIRSIEIPIWIIISSVILCIPTVTIFPALLTDSAPVFVLLILIFWINNKSINKWIKIVFEMILIFLCVGIRINSLTVFGFVILLYMYILITKKKMKYLWTSIIIFIGCISGIIIPKVLMPNTYNASTLAMVWEMTGMVANSDDKEIKKELGEYGDVEEAIRRYGAPYLNDIVWDRKPPFYSFDIAGKYSEAITKLYIKTAIKKPTAFWKNKISVINCSLGISNKLITSARGIHSVDNLTKSYGAIDNEVQRKTRTLFSEFTDAIGIISLRPIVLIGVCIILISILFLKKEDYANRYLKLLGIAVAYYSGFLINTQAYEYRYYAPSFYIMFVILICAITCITMGLIQFIKENHRE